MVPIIFKYPLDLEGTSPTNKVINEAHTIGSLRGRLFAPDSGPFFGNSVVVIDGDTGEELEANTQYKLAHYYHEASSRSGQPVYAAVAIVDPNIGTNILFTGQMVGGEFSYSYYAIKEALEALANDTRPVYWGELIGVPATFNPAPHLHSIYDTYDWMTMIWAQNDVAAAIREGDAASRALLLQQISMKLNQFEQYLHDSIEDLKGQGGYTLIKGNTTVIPNRRYLFIGNWTATLPAIVDGVLDGDWVIFGKRLSDKPVIKSADMPLMTINGTDTIHEGVLYNVTFEQKAVWNGPAQRWEI